MCAKTIDGAAYNTRDKDARHLYMRRSRFMARTLCKEGACHDFVPQDVIRNANNIQRYDA